MGTEKKVTNWLTEEKQKVFDDGYKQGKLSGEQVKLLLASEVEVLKKKNTDLATVEILVKSLATINNAISQAIASIKGR